MIRRPNTIAFSDQRFRIATEHWRNDFDWRSPIVLLSLLNER